MNARKDEEEAKKENEDIAMQEEDESEGEKDGDGDGEEGEDEQFNPEDQEYEVFYDQDQIKNTFYNQQKDGFSDIKFERFDLFNQSDGLAGLKTHNKFIIEQYAPKERKDEDGMRLKMN